MSKEQNFAKLFRNSKFAKFDPNIPRVYVPTPLVSPSCINEPQSTDIRPAFFGFKRDLHPTHYGRPLHYVQMKSLDGKYGLVQLRNGDDRVRMYKIMHELQRLIGKSSDQAKSCFYSDFSHRPILGNEGARVPGRVLNKIENGGYAIGIAGIVAELPNAEIPPLQHFRYEDINNRRTFYFYVLKAEFDNQGRPKVVVSLRAQ